MDKPVKATVIPIDPEGKYILLIDFGSLNEEQKVIAKRKFMDSLQEWWASNNPLYVIATFGGTLALQKVK